MWTTADYSNGTISDEVSALSSERLGPVFRTASFLIRNKDDTPLSLGAVLSRTAARYPNHIAIKHEGEPITYRELDVWSNRLAHYFLASGLRARSIDRRVHGKSPGHSRRGRRHRKGRAAWPG